MHELDTAAQDYACFTNDLYSYQKEIEFEGEVHNLVLVIENFLGVDRMRARDIVADLMTARMREFEHIVATDLPAMFEEQDLDEEVPYEPYPPRRATSRTGCRASSSGTADASATPSPSSCASGRDRAPGFSSCPRGLGTSAARIPASMSRKRLS